MTAATSFGRLPKDDGSVITDYSVGSSESITYPGAPYNSPESFSLAGDGIDMNVSSLASRLQAVPANLTPPTSHGDDQGKIWPRQPLQPRKQIERTD